MLTEYEVLMRLIAGALAGLLVGFTRRHKPAGIRTFALISLGATILTVISLRNDFVGADPTRIISQIVSGIGFLGLGVIWKQGMTGKPTGLTTAAGIWVTASLGILIGLAMWFEAIVGILLAVLILYSKKSFTKAHLEDE